MFPYQVGESVLSALGGCKILRELSKLEGETESKVAMKELAQLFENLAHGEFDHKHCLSILLLNPPLLEGFLICCVLFCLSVKMCLASVTRTVKVAPSHSL